MARAKAKATPKTDDVGSVPRVSTKAPAKAPAETPKASTAEKTESFIMRQKVDAHAAADRFLRGNDREEVSRKESDGGNEGTRVTITYK